VRSISESLRAGKLVARIVSVVGAIYLILSIGVSQGYISHSAELDNVVDCSADWSSLPADLVTDGCPDILDVEISSIDVDPYNTRALSTLITIYPQGDTGFQTASGGILNNSVQVMYESAGETVFNIKSQQISGAHSVEMPLPTASNSKRYPFDTYKGTWSVIVEDDATGEPKPMSLSVSSNAINGFNLTYESASENAVVSTRAVDLDGTSKIAYTIERSETQKLMAFLLILITATGVFSSALVTVAVYRRIRPPSLAGLAWLATFLFALMQIRAEYPGNPPLGVMLDSIVTFPAIALLLLMIVLNAFAWLSRHDWDMENHLRDEM
jgi:hypothetical protein